MHQLPTSTPTTPIPLREMFCSETGELIALYSYGFYQPISFAQAITSARHRPYLSKEVVHTYVTEEETEEGWMTHRVKYPEEGCSCITIVEL